jgi:restriction endonuclease S subunit
MNEAQLSSYGTIKAPFQLSKLTEIATIRSGYQFRSKIEIISDGDIQVIQMKDINLEYNKLEHSEILKTNVEVKEETLLINNGDILFQARGFNNNGVLVENISEKTIAPSYFFIIRVNPSKVLSGYVSWYINQRKAQEYLKQNARGSSIPLISKDVLENLEIIIPPLDIQNKVIKIHNLNYKELSLLDELKQKKKILMEALLINEVFH